MRCRARKSGEATSTVCPTMGAKATDGCHVSLYEIVKRSHGCVYVPHCCIVNELIFHSSWYEDGEHVTGTYRTSLHPVPLRRVGYDGQVKYPHRW